MERNNFGCLHYNITVMVALRKESVDRNKNVSSGMPKCQVALRKESVDRNFRNVYDFPVCVVALRKESVDRNILQEHLGSFAHCRSPQGERG